LLVWLETKEDGKAGYLKKVPLNHKENVFYKIELVSI